MEIINDEDGSLDDLVKKARTDSKLKRLMNAKPLKLEAVVHKKFDKKVAANILFFDDKYLVSGFKDDVFYDFATGEPEVRFQIGVYRPRKIGDKCYVFAIGENAILDFQTQTVVATFPDKITSSLVKIDDTYVVLSLDCQTFYDLSGKRFRRLTEPVEGAFIEIDGKYYARQSLSDRLIDIETEETVFKFPGSVHPFVFKVEGKYMILDTNDKTIYNVKTGKKEYEMPEPVWSLVLQIDDVYLMLGHDDKSLFNIETGELLLTLPKTVSPQINDVRGKKLVCGRDQFTFYEVRNANT
jgi:hypothetical protein